MGVTPLTINQTYYKYKYKIKTYNAPYVTRVIRRRGDDTRLGSIGNAKKMTF